MNEDLIKNFKQLSKRDVEIAGGKGASLGEMTQAGISVPQGFVIVANAFDKFLEETNLNVKIDSILDKVNIEESHTVESASEKIQGMIISGEISAENKAEILKNFEKLNSKFVAVRSSATSEDSASAAWAGQLDSFLNTIEETLLKNVKKCWASLFTPRAIFYRFEKKLNKDKISVAVVVQKMVDSEESGIAFSVHPVTQDKNQIIIEAGFGLGEAIVSGSITPDSYIIDKKGEKKLEVNVNVQNKALYRKIKGGNKWKELKEKGRKQVLTKKEIIELSKLIVKIENHYGFPVDIEWAREKGKYYIVQSRPITTLTAMKDKSKRYTIVLNDFQSPLVRNEIWTSLPSFWKEWYGLSVPSVGISSHKNTLDYFLDLKQWMQTKEEFQEKISKDPLLLREVIDLSVSMGEEMNKFTSQLLNNSFKEWSSDKMISFYKKYCFLQSREYAIGALLPLIDIYGVSFLESFLKKYLAKHLPRDKQRDAHKVFTTPIANSFSLDQDMDLLLLADEIFKSEKNKQIFLRNKPEDIPLKLQQNDLKSYRKLKKHAEKYGWVYYVYLGPAFGDVQFSEFLKQILKKNINPIHEIDRKSKEREGLIKKRKEYLKLLNPSKTDKILIELISTYVLAKPRRKDYQSRSYYHLENFYQELSKKVNVSLDLIRSAKQKQIYSALKYGKIDEEQLKRQYKHHVCYLSKKGAVVLSGESAENFIENQVAQEKIEIENTEIITGNTAFPGKVTGSVKVINDKTTMAKMKDGDILVSIATTPSIVPVMKKAGAIVTDEGGLTCHAAIVSRELEVPCIVGTKFASKLLKDGDFVEVDASQGIIKILKKDK